MGNINNNLSKIPNSTSIKPPSGGIKPETSSKPNEQALQQKLEGHSHQNDPFKDQLGKLPNVGGSVIKPAPMFNDVGKDVERVLSIGVMHAQANENGQQIKTPGVEFHLNQVMQGMNNGEKDELRDAIVERMSSKDTTQRERDVLQRMYNHVDGLLDKGKVLNDIKPGGPNIIQGKPPFDPGIKPGGPHIIQGKPGLMEKLQEEFQKQPGIGHEGHPKLGSKLEQISQGAAGIKEGIKEGVNSISKHSAEAQDISDELNQKMNSMGNSQGAPAIKKQE